MRSGFCPHWTKPNLWPELDAEFPQFSPSHATVLLIELPPFGEDSAFALYLSEPERLKAGKYANEIDRRRFVTGRGLIRLLMGRHYGCDPGAIALGITSTGKPELETVPHGPKLHFSVSHSGSFVLLGFYVLSEIGVDIERVDEDVDVSAITTQFFGAAERAEFHSILGAERALWFFERWTVREAVLKASGLGLQGLENLISEPRLMRAADRETFAVVAAGRVWCATLLPPFDNHVSAVSLPSTRDAITRWRWRLPQHRDWSSRHQL